MKRLRLLAAAGLALLAPLAAAQKTVPLETCLAQFEGIRWKLPYRPYMHVGVCAGPEGLFNAGAHRAEGGKRVVEFIGDSTIAPARNGMAAENFGEMQLAVFAHFDRLFQRHGFQRFHLEESEDHAPRYPKVAKYRRFTGAGPVVLTYRTVAANVWAVGLQKEETAR